MSTEIISNILLVLTWVGSFFVIALWLSLIVWTYRDIQKRTNSPTLKLICILAAAIFFIPGVLVYLILRPSETQDQEYQRTLEEEALLQSLDDFSLCPGCNRHIREDWMVCPSCHTRLKKLCPKCGKPMELAWDICPYCETPQPGMRRENRNVEETLSALAIDMDKE
jgi:RNA polymerase subunit RPABC4/transcription elongation factor Spt4